MWSTKIIGNIIISLLCGAVALTLLQQATTWLLWSEIRLVITPWCIWRKAVVVKIASVISLFLEWGSEYTGGPRLATSSSRIRVITTSAVHVFPCNITLIKKCNTVAWTYIVFNQNSFKCTCMYHANLNNIWTSDFSQTLIAKLFNEMLTKGALGFTYVVVWIPRMCQQCHSGFLRKNRHRWSCAIIYKVYVNVACSKISSPDVRLTCFKGALKRRELLPLLFGV